MPWNVQLTEQSGSLAENRHSTMTMAEFVRHCGARKPQPLDVLSAALMCRHQLLEKLSGLKETEGAFRLRQAVAQDDEMWVSVGMHPKGVSVQVHLEIMRPRKGKRRIEKPEDQEERILTATATIGAENPSGAKEPSTSMSLTSSASSTLSPS